MPSEHLGEGSSLLCDLAAIPRETADKVGEASDPDRVVIAPGQQCGTRCRAHRRRVKARVAQPLLSQPIDRQRFDLRAVTAKIRKADIVEQHYEDIWCVRPSLGLRWPPGRRLVDGGADLALE
jgi:hypothetical protein